MTAKELMTAGAVRSAAQRMLTDGLEGKLQNWRINLDALPSVADIVATVTRHNYPNLEIPFHSRWRHFDVGGLDRWGRLQASWDELSPREKARRAFDLVIPSVLSDAGSGGVWTYFDDGTRQNFTSSEGLALASLKLYQEFSSSDSSGALSAARLEGLREETFEKCFQVAGTNPLAGVRGRVELLRALGRTCRLRPDVFATNGIERPGGLVDAIFQASRDNAIAAPKILSILLDALAPIWPSRISLHNTPLGDSWLYSPWQNSYEPEPDCIVPFHKLSQWMTFSLIEPLQQAGLNITDVNGLTGLAEYRNGGLLVDGNVLLPRNPSMLEQAHRPESTIIVEWRALTVSLLDKLRLLVADRLDIPGSDFPLPCLLEGGTWSAGRYLAQQKRIDRSSPIKIVSDGTVF